MRYLSTDEVQKSIVLLSEVLADNLKAWTHSYSPTQTALNSGYPDLLFIYYEHLW